MGGRGAVIMLAFTQMARSPRQSLRMIMLFALATSFAIFTLVFLATHLGMAIRFDECDVRSMGRPAYGVRGISLVKNDFVVGVAITPKEHEEGAYRILSVTENGFGKRTSSYEYRTTGRGGKGIVAMSVNNRNGKLVASFPVEHSDQIMLVTDKGQLIRCPVEDIRIAHDALESRGVGFDDAPHLIHRFPDHELWMCFFRDSEKNNLALMSEVRPSPRI